MKTAMDGSGRVVIPAKLRAQLGLQPGQQLEVRAIDRSRLELEPVSVPARLVMEDGLLVFDAAEPMQPLTDEEVREALEADRLDREDRWG